jgi:hypothetical protein
MPLLAADDLNLASLVASTSLDSTLVTSLVRSFSLNEIRASLFSKNDNSSPGPDGFGPSFLQ